MDNAVGKGNAKGDILHFPLVSNLTVNDIADNADIAGQTVTETEVTITLDKKKEASIYIQKHLANNFSKYDIRKEYTGKIGFALAKQMDTDVIGVLDLLTTGAQGSAVAALADSHIRGGMSTLDTGDVPMEGRNLLMYPARRSDLLAVTNGATNSDVRLFAQQHSVGTGQPTVSGTLLNVYGMPVFFSTNIAQKTSGGNHRIQFMLHPEAVMLAKAQEPDLSFDWIPRRKAFLLSGDTLYGVGNFRGQSHVVQILTAD